ncbi:LTA synthase family protein [soil metagenome]
MRLRQRQLLTAASPSIRLLATDYLLGLIAFTILRIIFLLFNHHLTASVPGKWIALSLIHGIQFDSVACGMILALPFVLLFSGMIFKKYELGFQKAAFISVTFLFTIAFFAAFADIPLFMQFGKRLSVAALLWSDSPGFALKIIFGNLMHLFLIALFMAFSFLFYRIRKGVSKKIISSSPSFSLKRNLLTAIICGGLLLFAIRGRVSMKSPIRWGTAYFCTNTFANQTVLNPFYTFLTSVYESSSHSFAEYITMNDDLATKIFMENSGRYGEHKFLKTIAPTSSVQKRNVIFVVMESMAAWKTGLYPGGQKLTPQLDNLATKGIFFSDFYSDGIHTFNGLYSTLTGSSCLPGIQPLSAMNINSDPVTIAELLRANGYSTSFFTTHDVEFDNMNGFMRGNGFENVFGEHDYNYSTGINPMGVPDHILFIEARQKINNISKNGKPFFATLLTGSDHEPFKIPENVFSFPKEIDARQKATMYADWSIGQFMEACKTESWYSNTYFVFVADHGGIAPFEKDMYLAFHHIPCIIIGPGISPSVNQSLSIQADVLPTVMGILGLGYENTCMGIDLMKQKRSRLFFSYDEEVCSLDSTSFYVQRPIDSHLFIRNLNETYCAQSEDAKRISAHKEFIAATLQLIEQRMFGNKKKN